MNCERCAEAHDGSYGSGRFCSARCARSFATAENRDEISEKVRATLKGRPSTGLPFQNGPDPRRANAAIQRTAPEYAARSTDEKGQIAEAGFVFLALLNRIELHRPVNPQSRHDFLANGKKVQVKMGRWDNGAYKVNLVKRRRLAHRVEVKRYREEDFDFLAVFNEDERDFWIVPAADAVRRSDIRFWTTPVNVTHGFDSSVYWKRWDLFGV